MYAQTIDGDPSGVRVKAVVGVIISDGKGHLLMERRSDNGLWGLPGGAIEPGESVTEAALREVWEETRLTIRISGLVGVYSTPSDGRIVTYPDNGDVAQLVDIVLSADRIDGTPTTSAESIDLAFFPPERLPGEMAAPAVRPIQDYVAGFTGVIR